MPDITNDFDNNPNTDKRKQRDEEVNNDNLQPEQTKSEPELLDQTKSKEFSIPIFAKLYDRCNLKIDELNLKNDKLNAKIEKLNIKKVRSAEFVSTVESMRNVVPMPVYKALSVLSAERRQKIVNINEKIHSHKLNIKSNEQKILKQQSRADNCKKINKFLDNMKSPDGRKENFVKGMQENNPQALKKQADVIVSSAAKAVFEENYLKNAEMSIEDDYDSIDGIINNGNKQQEYEKLKEPEKKSERRTAPLSRNQIKQNANTIAHNEQQTNDKTKTQGQEL